MHDLIPWLFAAAAIAVAIPLYKRNSRIQEEQRQLWLLKGAELNDKWRQCSFAISDKDPANVNANSLLFDAAQHDLLPYHPSYARIIVTTSMTIARMNAGIAILDDLKSRLEDNRWSDFKPVDTDQNSGKYVRLRETWIATSVEVHKKLPQDMKAHRLLMDAALCSILPYTSSTNYRIIGAGDYDRRYDEGFARLDELNTLLKAGQA